jgi:hypothetical protein
VRVVKPVQGKTADVSSASFPLLTIKNLQGFDKDRVFSFSTTYRVRPILSNVSDSTTGNPFHLNIISEESFTGNFRYRSHEYKVAVRSSAHPVLTSKPSFDIIRFARSDKDSVFMKRWDARPVYRRGDTAVVANQVLLSEMSRLSLPALPFSH